MNIPENSYMPCPVWECDYQEPVSTKDPDSALRALWSHVRDHAHNRAATGQLMALVKLMDEDGNEVKP